MCYPGLSSVWFGDWRLLSDYTQYYVYILIPTVMDMGRYGDNFFLTSRKNNLVALRPPEGR